MQLQCRQLILQMHKGEALAPRRRCRATVRSLDYCLYAWLTEGDERRFTRAFSTYFSLAFPAVLRHLTHLSSWDKALLEDLAQEALLRFFEIVGRSRPAAARAVAETIRRIAALPLGPCHEREVLAWTRAVSACTEAATRFAALLGNESAEEDWKAAARALGAELALLRTQGYELLRSVQLALRPADRASSADPFEPQLADRFALEVAAGGAGAAALEHHCRGVGRFCADVHRVIRLLARLRAPTNSLLFQVAVNLYLDERKKRRSLKRGGMNGDTWPKSPTSEAALHTLPGGEEGADSDEYGIEGAHTVRHGVEPGELVAIDPAQYCASNDFFEKFYAHLRRPLEEAERACQQARASGRMLPGADRHRLASLTNKFARTMSVLSLLGEGYSQDEAAARLALSRNQVKYIVETTREDYRQFSAAAEPVTARRGYRDASYAG